MNIRMSWLRKRLPSGKGLVKGALVTLLALLALSGPVYATSGVLIPYLTIIQQIISDQLTKTISDGFKKTADNLIKSQVEQFTKELTAKMMPGAFCQSDIAKTVIGGSIARATGLDEAKGMAVITGADSILNGQRSFETLPSNDTALVIAEHNKAVQAYAQRAARQKNNCSPVQASPVDLTGSNITCTQEERRVANAVLLGASPPAKLQITPGTASNFAEEYESARTTSIGRKGLAGLALSDASNSQKEAMIKAYREALKKPSVDELNQLTATGGVQRDSIVMQQLTAQLLLESYVESLETKRLLATIVAQQAEADDREHLAAMRRRR